MSPSRFAASSSRVCTARASASRFSASSAAPRSASSASSSILAAWCASICSAEKRRLCARTSSSLSSSRLIALKPAPPVTGTATVGATSAGALELPGGVGGLERTLAGWGIVTPASGVPAGAGRLEALPVLGARASSCGRDSVFVGTTVLNSLLPAMLGSLAAGLRSSFFASTLASCLSTACQSLTRSAYRMVLSECSQHAEQGETLAIITVREDDPTNESFKTCVSLDPRKGTCALPLPNARMHSFRHSRDLFISAPSRRFARSSL
mmetsp:Transcript_29853/g.91621  ORF Transcript_29853/g.91621 Transcript_29853/m.91621 type:complete len:267 (-) Transcript_29853:1906-2706(-)